MIGHLSLALAIGGCFPVEADRILMRDLAAAIPAFASADPQQSIGFAPAPGAQRRFSAGEISRIALRYGVTAEPEPVCFERKLQPLREEQVLGAMRDSLPKGVRLELMEFSHLSVPNGGLEFPPGGLASAPEASPHEPVIWRGRVRYGAAQSIPVWAKIRVFLSRATVLAARDLPVGKPIQPDQIQVQTVDASPFAPSENIEPEGIVGLLPRRPIRAGHVIPRSALETPSEVVRGEMVGIEAHFGGALLKYEVRAEASGRVGDQVPVRNVDSGKTVRARVVRKGWVAVE